MTDIPFVQEAEPAYGAVERMSPRLRRVLANNPSPFTYRGTGTYIVGEGEVAVVDPGPLMESHLEALVSALAGETVKAIVLTHSHLDHSPLTRPLQERVGGVVYGRPDPGAEGGEGSSDTGFMPDVIVQGGDRTQGPGWTLRALPTPGHASNHVAYVLEEENALLVGDHVMGWSTTIVSPPDGDMGDYLASLDAVIDGDFAALYPAHGPPIPSPARFLRAYKGHRLLRERQVLDQLADGPKTIQAMVAALYANVDPRLHPAAARSVWAHLIHLVNTGRASAEGGAATLKAVYQRV